jgi:hypothetical protein
VNSLLHTSTPRQYAVISVRTVPQCERLVIAYPDEKTLRDLLARPSILALGYRSREQAEASICRYGVTPQPLQRKSMGTLVANKRQTLKESVSGLAQATHRFSWAKMQSTLCGLLQQTLAAAVVLLYSKNLLSAAVRALISF